jgi:hypothetical protein
MKIREAGPEDAEGIASVHISNPSVATTDMGRRAGCSLITVWPEDEAKGFYENLGFKPIFKGYRVILSAEAEPDFYPSWGEPPESPPFSILLGRYQCSWQHWRLDASMANMIGGRFFWAKCHGAWGLAAWFPIPKRKNRCVGFMWSNRGLSDGIRFMRTLAAMEGFGDIETIVPEECPEDFKPVEPHIIYGKVA